MRTELLKRRANAVVSSCHCESDKLTEFYEMARIAQMAISEVELLRQEMKKIQEIIKNHSKHVAAVMVDHVADMALRRAE